MKNKIALGIIAMFIVLILSSTNANIQNLYPLDNFWTNQTQVEFNFTLDNSTNTSCVLTIDGIIVENKTANETTIFTKNLSERHHTWQITCVTGNTSDTTETRNIYVDRSAPNITIVSPQDDMNYTNVSSIKFIPTDNLAENITCTLNYNGNYTTFQTYNNTEVTYSINPSIGSHYYSVLCNDSLGQIGESDNINFNIINTTKEPFIDLNLEYDSYAIGAQALMQITALNGSNVSIDVCPNQQGFVLCIGTLTYTSNDYPIIEKMPFVNKTGNYVLDATMQYGSKTKSVKENFTITNSIVIGVDGDTTIEQDETTEIELELSGGIAPYTVAWTLDDGSTSTSKVLNFTYDEAGTYNNLVKVTDVAGNKKNTTVSIVVSELFELIITAKDEVSGNAIQDVEIEVDNKEDSTDINGRATFYLTKGNKDIIASHPDYRFYTEDDYKITANQTKTILLSKEDSDAPDVTILSPSNGAKIPGTALNISYKVDDDASSVNCDLYVAAANEQWYSSVESATITSTATQYANLDGFVLGTYKFKIECVDQNDNVGESNEIEVEFVDAIKQEADQQQSILINELYDILDSLPSKTAKQKEVLDTLEIEQQIKNAIKTVERTTRDIYNVEFRRDMTDEEKVEKQKELMDNIDRIYKTTPQDISIIASKTYVKYITDDELESVVKEYASLEGYQEAQKYANVVKKLQKEMTVTSNVKSLEMTYFDGNSETITLVEKKLAYNNESKKWKVLEHIPKEVIESTDDMTILTEHKIIDKDPILEFEDVDTIVYYVKGSLDLTDFEDTNTILLPDSYTAALSSITGNVVFAPDLNFNARNALIFLIVILTLIYGSYHFHGIDKVKVYYYTLIGDKKVHNVRMMVNDAIDNIEAKNYQQAYLIYREVKMYYDKLSTPGKNQVYDDVMTVCHRLDFDYAKDIVKIIMEDINSNKHEKAAHLYNKLRIIYKKLSDDDKKIIYDEMLALSGKIAK